MASPATMTPEMEQKLFLEELLAASELGDVSLFEPMWAELRNNGKSRPEVRKKNGRGRGVSARVMSGNVVEPKGAGRGLRHLSQLADRHSVTILEKRQEALQSIHAGERRNETIESHYLGNDEMKSRHSATKSEIKVVEENTFKETSPKNSVPEIKVKKKNRKERNAMLNALNAKKNENSPSIASDQNDLPVAEVDQRPVEFFKRPAKLDHRPAEFVKPSEKLDRLPFKLDPHPPKISETHKRIENWIKKNEYSRKMCGMGDQEYPDAESSGTTPEFTDCSSGLASTSPSPSKYQDCVSSGSSRKIGQKTAHMPLLSEDAIGFNRKENRTAAKTKFKRLDLNSHLDVSSDSYQYFPDIRDDKCDIHSPADFPPL